MAWWVPLAMAAGGYMIDKQMGGNGMKGALLGAAGGAFMPAGAGLTSGAAATTAGGTGATMTGLLGDGGVGMGGWGSGSVGGMTGTGFSPAAKAVLPNAMPLAAKGSYPSLLTSEGGQGISGNGLTNLFTQGKDYISDGFSDMTFADQLGVGLQAEGLLNRPTQQIQVPQLQPIDNRSQVPTAGKPLITQIQGIHQRKPTEEELIQYSNRPYYGQ